MSRIAAVVDGADGIQECLDDHRIDAVREAGHRWPDGWLDGVRHRRTLDGPERVLVHLAPVPEVRAHWQDLLQRYFQAAGWPMESGMVESATTRGVEARRTGAGMHGKREHVTFMLILRHAVCHDRWNETWQGRRKQAQGQRTPKRHDQRDRRQHQAIPCVMRLWLSLVLLLPHQREPVVVPLSTEPATPPARTRRTEAQDQWGR